MPETTITVTFDNELLAKIDGVAAARGYARDEFIQRACRDFVRQMQQIDETQRPSRPGVHAVDMPGTAADLWAAAWIDTVIDPDEMDT